MPEIDWRGSEHEHSECTYDATVLRESLGIHGKEIQVDIIFTYLEQLSLFSNITMKMNYDNIISVFASIRLNNNVKIEFCKTVGLLQTSMLTY